jgi:predicted nucleotidyltransferase/DNA-binding transcriptional ArsR family regulator
MDVSRPYGVVSHPLDSAVLQVLTGTTRGMSGRRVAELAGNAQEGVRKALRRLVDTGIVEQREAGNAILYRFNRRHLAAPAVEQLTDLRRALLTRLTEAFGTWTPPPLHASVFGSTARGDGDSNSDIDLFVVRPGSVEDDNRAWREQIERLPDDVRDWTGNHANVVEIPEAALPDLRRRRPTVVRELEVDALTLVGPEIAALLGDEG